MCGLLVHLFICACGNNDDLHYGVGCLNFINNADANTAELDFQKICQIGSGFVSERLAISAILLGKRVLRYFLDPFNDLDLNAVIQSFQVLY